MKISSIIYHLFSGKQNLFFEREGLDNYDSEVLEKICVALRDDAATSFVEKLFKNHYKNFLDNSYADQILSTAFTELVGSQIEGHSIERLKIVLIKLANGVYSTKDNKEFFEAYSRYKTFLKPAYNFAIVSEDFIGEKILDFGSGNGYLSKIIQENKYSVISADTLNYSELNSKNIPFVELSSVSDIGKKIQKVDTAVAVTVFHHIDKALLSHVLQELSKIAKRLIVIEDVVDSDFFNHQKLAKSSQVLELGKLSIESRNNAISLTDFYGNVVTQGLTNMKLPFEFKTTKNWIELFEKNGFVIKKVSQVGFPTISFHGFYQVKIVCDSRHFIR